MVVKKDFYGTYTLPQANDEALVIPNYEVMGVMKSLKDKGICRETFKWGWHYYFLASESETEKTEGGDEETTTDFTGKETMREMLGLPDSVIPHTHRVPEPNRIVERPQQERGGRGFGGRGGRPGGMGGRGPQRNFRERPN